jgi:hypothetical protein
MKESYKVEISHQLWPRVMRLNGRPCFGSKRIREHRGIENQQHYIINVAFSEDASRIRKTNSPEISSVFRRLALSILQRDTTIKDNIRDKRSASETRFWILKAQAGTRGKFSRSLWKLEALRLIWQRAP